MMIQTSKRLSTLVEWIDGTVLADIGCDHGYVAVNAILLEKVENAYACDIAQGQLENAKKTERFMGVYTYFDTKFWIMSDYDCTIDTLVITVLLPEEY